MGNLCLNDQSDPQLTSVGLSDLYFYKSHFSCFWFTYKIPDLVIKKLAILHIVWKSNIKPKIYNEISHLGDNKITFWFEIVSFLHSLRIKLLITLRDCGPCTCNLSFVHTWIPDNLENNQLPILSTNSVVYPTRNIKLFLVF